MPDDLSLVRIERDAAVGVEVGSLSEASVKIRRGIADSPKEEIRFRIVGPREPCCPASEFPTILGPGLVPLLSWSGNCVKSPAQPAVLPFVGGDMTAVRGIAAGGTDDDHVFDDERSSRDVASVLLRIFYVHLPHFFAGLRVERHDEVIET